MPRRYVVNKLAKKPPLPKEVTPASGPRSYVDRWGVEYNVWWNGQPSDPPLTRSYAQTAAAST